MLRCVKLVLGAALLVVSSWQVSAQTATARQNPFLKAKSWAYQLNNLGPEQQARIAASPYDLVVIDYARSAAGDLSETPLTREEVERMKVKPDGGRRVIIAYLSIGESEDNRYYWRPEWNKRRPAWMGAESKEWKGNYLVKYWEPAWQKIIYGNPESYADRIIAAGFDGFYVDRADAYYRFGNTKQSLDRMTDFVVKLIAYIRTKQPNAGIMMQNAEELLDRPNYVAAIDAIAKEDLIYGITHREEINKRDDIDYSTKLLGDAQKAGKAIFVVEYLKNPKNIDDAKRRMSELGFVLYYGPRGLFEIASGPAAGGPTPGPALDGVRERAPATKAPTKAKSAVKAKAPAKAN